MRLNTDGSSDTTLTPIQIGVGLRISKILLQPDGKFLIAANTSSLNSISIVAVFKRYNADGSLDSTFEPPTFTGSSLATTNGYSINDFEILPDNSVVIVGFFTSVNGISRLNIVKLLPAGNVDLSFAPTRAFQSQEPANEVEVYSNGKFLVSTRTAFGPSGSGTTNKFIRYNVDGSIDNNFAAPANLALIRKFVIDSSDSVLFYGSFTENDAIVYKFARLSPDGSMVSSFVVDYGIGGSVTTLAVQADNKIVIGGNFTQVGGISRSKVARINADGSVDQTFNAQFGANDSISKVAVQADGKILLSGYFTINNSSGYALIRLNADGSSDPTFNCSFSYISVIVPLPDGKILVGGSFYGANGQSSSGVSRLNSDGTLDTSFNTLFANAAIRAIVLQADGKIIVGGAFSGVNGFNRTNLVRLNADGTLDTAFNAGNIASVSAVELYPNGKYIVSTQNTVIRVNADGTTDSTFQSPILSGTINAISVQPDGSVIVGGNLGPFRILRLRATGTVDTTAFPNGANDGVQVILRQSDGQILVGGDFTMIANAIRFGIARLSVGAFRTPFDFDGDGRADISVFRPSNGFWYRLFSQNNAFNAFQFGQSGDKIAPADYDGDGRADVAVFRDVVPGAGNQAYFYITYSSTGAFRSVPFGTAGDVPMSGDWDGDSIADLAVYRSAVAAGGQSYFIYRASSIPNAGFTIIPWGSFGDKPVTGDYDGDGKLDAAIFRLANSTWYVASSSSGQAIVQPFGVATDIPAPADFDGDGITNFALFRPSTGYWYRSTNPQTNYGGV